jgi:hypothetical protein
LNRLVRQISFRILGETKRKHRVAGSTRGGSQAYGLRIGTSKNPAEPRKPPNRQIIEL